MRHPVPICLLALPLLLCQIVAQARESELDHRLGAYLDEADRVLIERVFEAGNGAQHAHWRNAVHGVAYSLHAYRSFDTLEGICRGFRIEADTARRRIEAEGTACRDDYGWRVVE